MPYASRYKKRSTYAKRRYRRKARTSRTKFRSTRARSAPLQVGGFPEHKTVKLRYVEQTTLTPGAGTLPIHQYRANSIFDPDLTGVGHQPMNHDIWELIYHHYTVIGAKLTVTFTNSDPTQPVVVGIQLDDNATTPGVGVDGAWSKVLEQGRVPYRTLTGQTGSKNTSTITKNYSARKAFNLRDTKACMSRTPDIGAAMAANPIDDQNWVVWCASLDGNASDAIYCNVVIDYIVVLTEKQDGRTQS